VLSLAAWWATPSFMSTAAYNFLSLPKIKSSPLR
jgi:hypothetical protein